MHPPGSDYTKIRWQSIQDSFNATIAFYIQTVLVTRSNSVEVPAAPHPRQQISRISDEVTPVNLNILAA